MEITNPTLPELENYVKQIFSEVPISVSIDAERILLEYMARVIQKIDLQTSFPVN